MQEKCSRQREQPCKGLEANGPVWGQFREVMRSAGTSLRAKEKVFGFYSK